MMKSRFGGGQKDRVLEAIELDEEGALVDGSSRLRACAPTGVAPSRDGGGARNIAASINERVSLGASKAVPGDGPIPPLRRCR